MSVVVEGVCDLPFLDFSDTEGLYEILTLLHEHKLIDLTGWAIEVQENCLYLENILRKWSWIKITQTGFQYDKHYVETEEFALNLLDCLNKYYPMFKKALNIISQHNIKHYNLSFDKEKEKILLEVYDE
jgi:hypothetical protein